MEIKAHEGVKSPSELREEASGDDGGDLLMVAVFTVPSIIDSLAVRARVNVPKRSLQTAEVGDHESVSSRFCGFHLFPFYCFDAAQLWRRSVEPKVFSSNSCWSSCSGCLEMEELCLVLLLVRATFLLTGW